MATNIEDGTDGPPITTLGPNAHTYERYAQVRLEEDVLLLYDRDHEEAWITSDTTLPVAQIA